MQPVLRAQWNSRVAQYRTRVNKACGTAARDRLIRIRDRWAADVRVDTGHYRDVVASTEPRMTSETGGVLEPPFEPYFYWNEYGTPGGRMSARPSMRQAIAAEESDFNAEIARIVMGT